MKRFQDACLLVGGISCENYHELEDGFQDAVWDSLKLLWECEPIQAAFSRRNEFYLLDSAKLSVFGILMIF